MHGRRRLRTHKEIVAQQSNARAAYEQRQAEMGRKRRIYRLTDDEDEELRRYLAMMRAREKNEYR